MIFEFEFVLQRLSLFDAASVLSIRISELFVTDFLLLVGGDADEEDINYCFDPLSIYFEEVELQNEAALRDVRGIAANSRIFFSSRVLMLPFIEIRRAQQEDHDDLADVFNNQSETVTEAYGEYFLAELIAA